MAQTLGDESLSAIPLRYPSPQFLTPMQTRGLRSDRAKETDEKKPLSEAERFSRHRHNKRDLFTAPQRRIGHYADCVLIR